MKTNLTLFRVAGPLLLLAAFSANQVKASPLPVFGDINFVGTATLNKTSFTSATTITKVTSTVSGPLVDDGDYSTVAAGVPVTIFTPIDFAVLATAPLSSVEPVWQFKVGTITYSFEITGPVDILQQNAHHIDLGGTGIASITGDASNAAASWELNIGTTGGKTTFGFSTSVVRVPDRGTTALLIGIGLAAVGVGVIARRKPVKE
jgi:hypothetical protein